MDDEVLLLVGQRVVGRLVDDDTCGHFLAIVISSDSGTCLHTHGGDGLSLTFFANGVRLAAIVVEGLRIIAVFFLRVVLFLEGQLVDVLLLDVAQGVVGLRVNLLADGVGYVAAHEGALHHVVFAGGLDCDGRVVVLLVGDVLELLAGEPLRLVGAGDMANGIAFLVRIAYCLLKLYLVVDRFGGGVDLRIERSVVLRLVAVGTAVGAVGEQVEGIVVVGEVLAILVRHRTPCVDGAVGLACLEVRAAVLALGGADVGIGDVVAEELLGLLHCRLAAGVVGVSLQGFHLRLQCGDVG